MRLVEGGPELVEGAVQAVDGEVAGEEAPVDAERLDGGLEPRGERVGAHRPGRRRQARTACSARSGRGSTRASMPACHTARSSSDARLRPAGVLDDDHEVVDARPGRARRPRAGRGGPAARTRRPAVGQLAEDVGVGQRSVERHPSGGPHGTGWPPSAGRSARRPRRPTPVGTMPPISASASPCRSISRVSSIEWCPVAAATFTSFSTFQPADSAR